MSITDELRNCIRTANRSYEDMRNPCNDREILHIPEEELLKIADRIDAEHERACAEAYGNGVMSVPIALDESQWVKLPVDADGEVTRIGDVMVMASHPFGCEDKPLVVDRMELSRDRHGEVWCLALDTDRSCWTQAAVLRHYHKPTVEDVLRDFADRVCNSGHQWGLDAADTIAEYATKLRLAEEVDA